MKYWTIIALMTVVLACKKAPIEENLVVIGPDTTQAESYDRTILLEPFTSTSCGACPLAHHEIEKLEVENDDVIHITHYLFGPLHHDYTNYVIEKVDKTLYTPLSFIQRLNGDAGVVYFGMDRLREMVDGLETEETTLGLNIESNLVGQDLTLEVAIETNDAELNVIGLTVLIVEDLVTGIGPGYDQRNYGNEDENHPYYDQGEYIEGFEHTNVIRHVVSAYDGDEVMIIEGSATWSVQFDTDNFKSEVSDYSVIAFATKSANVGSPILNADKLSL